MELKFNEEVRRANWRFHLSSTLARSIKYKVLFAALNASAYCLKGTNVLLDGVHL